MNKRSKKKPYGANIAANNESLMETAIHPFSTKKHPCEKGDMPCIRSLTDSEGHVVQEDDDIKRVFPEYFQNLFNTSCAKDSANLFDTMQACVTEERNVHMTKSYTAEEGLTGLNQMHPTKAPGPDGMPALFYQKFWQIVGGDIIDMVLDIRSNGRNPKEVNTTFVVLIPKVKGLKLLWISDLVVSVMYPIS